MWGGSSNAKVEPLLKVQKKCLRIIFGDREAYREKFQTCVRSRRKQSMILGERFFRKKDSKPLFNSQDILTVYNSYIYHLILSTFKVLKYRTPSSIHSLLPISKRKDTLLLSEFGSTCSYIRNTSTIWNAARQKFKLHDLSQVKIGTFKNLLKKTILGYQKLGDKESWARIEIDVTVALKTPDTLQNFDCTGLLPSEEA